MEEHFGGVVLLVQSTQVHSKVVHWRLSHWTFHRLEGGLMCELRWWEGRRLLMHLEWVDILELLRLHVLWHLGLEAIEGRGLLSSMQGAFRCRHR